MTDCTCAAKITDPERAKRFAGIFENDWIPIRYPLIAGTARTVQNDRLVEYEFYEVAIERLTPEQKQKVAEAVAKAGFDDVTVEEVLRDFDKPNVTIPLRADGVIVHWCERHVRAAL
jgi:hypothetical protein